MKPQHMRRLHGEGECHDCAPEPWREVPVVTGDYDMDGTILARSNSDLPSRLALYTRRGRAYGPLTGYNGYSGYHGDN